METRGQWPVLTDEGMDNQWMSHPYIIHCLLIRYPSIIHIHILSMKYQTKLHKINYLSTYEQWINRGYIYPKFIRCLDNLKINLG